MLKTSRWVLHINNMFMKQDLTAQINVDGDGNVTFYAVTPNGLRPFPKEMSDKLTFDGDTISAEVSLEEGKNMKVTIAVTFGEDTAEGYFKIPIFGKLKFKGERIELTDLPVLSDEQIKKDNEMTPEEAAAQKEEILAQAQEIAQNYPVEEAMWYASQEDNQE